MNRYEVLWGEYEIEGCCRNCGAPSASQCNKYGCKCYEEYYTDANKQEDFSFYDADQDDIRQIIEILCDKFSLEFVKVYDSYGNPRIELKS